MRMDDAQILATLSPEGASAFSPAANLQLLDRVPEELRLVHYTRQSIPTEYLASFGYYHNKIGNIHLDGLPETIQRELVFTIWRIVELGGRVPCAPLGLLSRELAATVDRLAVKGEPVASLLDRTPAQWRTELGRTWARRTGGFPNPQTLRTYVSQLDRACKLLWFAYDVSQWWRRELWDPVLDDRIPRREHEPRGTSAIHWHRIEPDWLRIGAMWYAKRLLETGLVTWSTALARHSCRSSAASRSSAG